MKALVILLAILSGYFLPNHTFSTLAFLASILVGFWFGFYFPDVMNANDLSDRWDRERPTLKGKISIHRVNTISLWIVVYVFLVAIVSVLKGIVGYWKVNELGLVILAFSLAAFFKLSNPKLVGRKALKH